MRFSFVRLYLCVCACVLVLVCLCVCVLASVFFVSFYLCLSLVVSLFVAIFFILHSAHPLPACATVEQCSVSVFSCLIHLALQTRNGG